jgi:hypothetical protein
MFRRISSFQMSLVRGSWNALNSSGLTPAKYEGRLRLKFGSQKPIISPEKFHVSQIHEFQSDSQTEPQLIITEGDRQYWLFKGVAYWDDEDLDSSDVLDILEAKRIRQTQSLSRSKSLANKGNLLENQKRSAIPELVKELVWKRDEGRCCYCAANNELQFDHIIPVALGGSNDEANIQILCGPCNRKKGASI